jgi:spermidine synthase
MKRPLNYLLLTAFIAGMSVMAIEMAISRLLAPYFGTSLFVWTNVLGLIMIALTIGYYVGGRIADRYASEGLLYKLLLVTGIYLSLVPFLAMPITRLAIWGIDNYAIGTTAFALTMIIILLILPFIALGVVTPYIIRLQSQRVDALGNTAGKVYTWSNGGSIVGTFLPALLTIPLIGTHKTVVFFACLLMLVSILGLANWKLLAIPALSLLLTNFLGKIKPTPGLLFDTESVYNYIQVVEENGLRMLRLNEGHAEHSLYQKNRYIFNSVWDYYLLPPLLNNSQSTLFIGLAAGTAARQYNHFLPHMKIDGVELDPAIVEVGKKYFELQKVRNLNIILKDGRVHLATTRKKYDTILIDAYKQPYIPFHLTTQEFFTEVKNHLNPKGIVAINVGSTKGDAEILLMIQNTMKHVFKHVYVVEVQYSLNYLVWATDEELDMSQVEVSPSHGELNPMVNYIKRKVKEVETDPKYPILTDDLAPLELYTEKMILDFALDWKRKYL